MNKVLFPLTALVLIAVALGVFVSSSNKVSDFDSSMLLPELQEKVEQISGFTVSNSEGVVFDAILQDGLWLSDNVANYPVDQEQLTDLLEALLEAEKVEPKTAKAENYSRLGVEDINAADSQSTLLQIHSLTGSWQVIVGNKGARGNGSYVRFPDEEQSWLTQVSIDLPTNKNDWLLQPILDMEKENIVSVARVDEQSWSATKAEDSDDFILDQIPEGRELKYDTVVNSVVTNIAGLKFDDLQQVTQSQWLDEQIVGTLQFTLQTGETVQILLAKIGDDHWAQFSSEDLESYWEKWQYKLSSFSFGQINKTIDDFLAELPEESQEEETSVVDEGDAPQ